MRKRTDSWKKPASRVGSAINDPRVAPFLFMDGRPKAWNDCLKGIKNWSDPCSVRSVTSHVYKVRDTLTLTERLGEHNGAVTSKMVGLLSDKNLEQYLEWKLDFPDPVRLEDFLTQAARSVAKNGSIDYVTLWQYLKNKVLNNSDLKKNLLDAFIAQWVPEVRGKDQQKAKQETRQPVAGEICSPDVISEDFNHTIHGKHIEVWVLRRAEA